MKTTPPTITEAIMFTPGVWLACVRHLDGSVESRQFCVRRIAAKQLRIWKKAGMPAKLFRLKVSELSW